MDRAKQRKGSTCSATTRTRVESAGGEGLPDDGLADVGGNEQRDARANAVALLQQLVKDDDDDAGGGELKDDEDGIAGAQVRDVTVHARHDVSHGLDDGDDDTDHCIRREGARWG